MLLIGPGLPAWALQGSLGAHDPSTIVKEGNKYWVFTTGEGIPSKYSTDLISWTESPRPVFTTATRPGWIRTRVPQFANTYWAPECVFMNGKYYLYYSCSTFGSKLSGVGLATNVTLDPTNPNYKWADEGEVISSDNSSASNAIDPAVYRDASNNLWFVYGSFFGGIRTLQLNSTTGKPLNGATTPQTAVANGDVEAAYVKQHGSFYYLFINRGACCRGSNSTYYIQVGRSATPTGPFVDQTGVDLNNGGGTLVLNVAGRYVGPGHTGILEEGGVSYFSHHYYDYEDNGAPKLGLAQLTWDAAGWPVVSRDWVAPGRYEIQAQSSGLVWEAGGCTGTAGQPISQGTRTGLNCQQWNFAALGNGDYKITNQLGGLAASVAGCAEAAGAKLQLGAYTSEGCQQFHVDRAADGTLVLAAVNGNRVVEVPGASTTAGQQLSLWDYNGCGCQRWTLTPAGTVTAATAAQALAGVSIYPVPASRSGFTINLGELKHSQPVVVEIFNLRGQAVYHQSFDRPEVALQVTTILPAGLYLVRVRQGVRQATQRLTVL